MQMRRCLVGPLRKRRSRVLPTLARRRLFLWVEMQRGKARCFTMAFLAPAHHCAPLTAQPWVEVIRCTEHLVSFVAALPPAADGTAILATPAVMGVALLFPAGPVGPGLSWLRTDQVAAVRAVAVAEARPPAAAAAVASLAAEAAFPPAQGDTRVADRSPQVAEPARAVAAGTTNH